MDGPAQMLRENEDVKEFYLGVAEGKPKIFREVKSYKRRKRWLRDDGDPQNGGTQESADHFDALDTASPRNARPISSRACRHGSRRRHRRRPAYAERLERHRSRRGHEPRGARRACRCCASPTCRRCTRQRRPSAASSPPAGRFGAALHLARADLRAGGRRARSLARRAGAVCRRLPPRRDRAQHLQLSPDARRLHHRYRRARAGLRRDSGRAGQHRAATRAHRGLSARSPTAARRIS